ncbi:hypothetical protein N7475_007584 [Penicillium sp. IBT 31633x]|nr:hypothetical protein N7475_007584 [Penicillium sp. IBT 31633x]
MNTQPSASSTSESVSDGDLSIVFRYRLTAPWEEQQVVNVEFSADNKFLIVLWPWREPTALTISRGWHEVLTYDLETRACLRLGPLGLSLLDGYCVAARGAAPGPASKKPNYKLSAIVPGKSRPVLPLAICHNPPINRALDSTPSIDIVDLHKTKRTRCSTTAQIQGPLAWSPDGSILAGLHFGDPTKISLFNAQMDGIPLRVCLPGQLAEITQLAFMPDGQSILSLASDGVGRMVSISPASPGKLLKSFCAPSLGRYPASDMQISPNGKCVASIWGRLIVRWHPDSDELESCDLQSIRPDADLFPLAISPECHLLACRYDTGVEVCDLLTGQRRGKVRYKPGGTGFATAAAFGGPGGGGGTMLAVGMFGGEVTIYSVLGDEDVPPVEVELHEQLADL